MAYSDRWNYARVEGVNSMNLENNIKDIINQKLEDGTIERIVTDQFEKGVEKAVGEIFGNFGNGTKTIKNQIESVVIPFLEKHDYSDYVQKLDAVLVEVLQATTAENRNLLNNFKELITPKASDTINATDLFGKYMNKVAMDVTTDDLDVDFDGGLNYESVCVTFNFLEDEKRSWSNLTTDKLIFECEHDEDMNYEILLAKWDHIHNGEWNIVNSQIVDIRSLRNMTEFEIFIMTLKQHGTTVILDEIRGEDEVIPEKDPEAKWY